MSKIIDYPTMATVKDAANQFSVSTAFEQGEPTPEPSKITNGIRAVAANY